MSNKPIRNDGIYKMIYTYIHYQIDHTENKNLRSNDDLQF